MKHLNQKLYFVSRRLDPLWWLIARMLRLRSDKAASHVPQSILVVDMHLLGDIVMLVPLLRVVRRCHPGAHVGLMAGPWARTILSDEGLVDEFIALRAPWVVKGQGVAGIQGMWAAVHASRQRSWDWGIDVRGDVRNLLLLALARAQRRIAYNFSGGAALLTDEVPDDGELHHIAYHHATLAEFLRMPMTAEERIPRLGLRRTHPRRVDQRRHIGFHFGASMKLRRMPVEEAAAVVLSCSGRAGIRLVLIDAPDTRELNSELLMRLPADRAAKIERWTGSLEELLGFLPTLDELYAMDSGPAHLAAALGVDTTVFFGPHVSYAVKPLGSNVTIIERDDVKCRPCDQRHCTNPQRQECLSDMVKYIEKSRPLSEHSML